jgi:hypothetical protein
MMLAENEIQHFPISDQFSFSDFVFGEPWTLNVFQDGRALRCARNGTTEVSGTIGARQHGHRQSGPSAQDARTSDTQRL